jgi:hypothetical protein
MRGEDHHAIDDAAEIDAELPVPVLPGGILDRTELRHTTGVEEELHRSEDSLGLVRCGLVGFPVGDVEPDRVHRGVAIAKPGHGFVEMVLPDVGDDDPAARLGEHLGLAKTDAGSAARDERHLACEIFHCSDRV